jgi:hypothetical protein
MAGPCPRLARVPSHDHGEPGLAVRGYQAMSGVTRHRSPARVDQGLPATVMRPRAIAVLAIAIHADRVDAPFGRFSVVLRAYTVKR